MLRIGIDVGGTKVEGIVLDEQGTELIRQRVPSPSHDYAALLSAITDLVFRLESAVAQKATVGLGIPGVISPVTGLVKNSAAVCLNGKPLDKDLESLLGRDLRFSNDANCFAVSEATDGAGALAKEVVFGVILGTGVGGGLVVARRPITGINAIAGEWGHNPLPQPNDSERKGPGCYCGRYGCIETFLSGPGLARDHGKVTGKERTAEQIVDDAREGSSESIATLARYEDRLSRALAGVINIVDPEVIVLGGGLSKIASLYENVPKLWRAYVFSDAIDTKLVPPRHGDSSGVRGAAWLWNG